MPRADTIISSLVLVLPFPFFSLPPFSLFRQLYVSALVIIPTVVLACRERLNKRKKKKGPDCLPFAHDDFGDHFMSARTFFSILPSSDSF